MPAATNGGTHMTKKHENSFPLATCAKTGVSLTVIFGKDSETLTFTPKGSARGLTLSRAMTIGLDKLRPLMALRAKYADLDRGQLADLVGPAADAYQPTAEDYGFDESEGAFSESITIHVAEPKAQPKARRKARRKAAPKAPKADVATTTAVAIMRGRIADSHEGRVAVRYDGGRYWCHYVTDAGLARLTAHHKADPNGALGFDVPVSAVR